MPFPEIDPGRLEALLAGRAAPETSEERETLALLAALERDDDTVSPEVGAWLDELAAGAPGRARGRWPRVRRPSGARGWLAVAAPTAAAVAIAVVAVVGLRGGDPVSAPPTAADRMALPEGAAQVAGPDVAAGRPFARTGGPPLAVRAGPGDGFRTLRVLSDGAGLRIACTVRAERVAGPTGASETWYRLSAGGYVPSALVQAPTAPRPPPCR